jgi:hypothetical protein
MRMSVILCCAALSGCAHDASSYRLADGGTEEAKERAVAACRNNASPILVNSGGLIALAAYSQSINDCMRAQGYVKQ